VDATAGAAGAGDDHAGQISRIELIEVLLGPSVNETHVLDEGVEIPDALTLHLGHGELLAVVIDRQPHPFDPLR
jgi:hypothetical protein